MSRHDFRGEVVRGAEWRGRDFSGLRVAVIAPGRDAARIVPAVLRTARSVKVFQEEADWVLPRGLPAPRVVRRVAARVHLRMRVKDPWTRRLLTPDRRFGSGRLASSGAFYPALQQPHCKLIAWPVYAIVAGGVRTAEGIEHQVDCIVIADSSVFAHDTAPAAPQREERTA